MIVGGRNSGRDPARGNGVRQVVRVVRDAAPTALFNEQHATAAQLRRCVRLLAVCNRATAHRRDRTVGFRLR